MQPSWTDSNGEVTDEEDDSHPNHPYLESNVERAKTKQKKRKKKKPCSCQLCGRVASVKTPPYNAEPHHSGPTCVHSHHRFQVSEVKIQTFCCSAPAPCFAPNQSDVNRCLYLEERPFFVVIQTTSKHLGSVVSVPPLLFSQRRRGGGAFIVSASTLRHLARLFLSLLRLMWRASTKARPGNKREERVG